jgi:hypothetical protein
MQIPDDIRRAALRAWQIDSSANLAPALDDSAVRDGTGWARRIRALLEGVTDEQ